MNSHLHLNLSPMAATQNGPQIHIPNSYIVPGRPPLTCMPAVQHSALVTR